MQANAKKKEKRNNRRQAQGIHSDEAHDSPKTKYNLEIDIDKIVLENKHFKMVSERIRLGNAQ